MNIYKYRILICIIALIAGYGCSTPAKFNQMYLPYSQNLSTYETTPKISIQLDDDVADRLSQWRYPGILKKSAYDTSPKITWIGDNNIILSMEDYGTYLITPDTKNIRKLNGAEEEVVIKSLRDRVFHEIAEKEAGLIGKALLSVFAGIETSVNFKGSIKEGDKEFSLATSALCLEPDTYACRTEQITYLITSKATGKWFKSYFLIGKWDSIKAPEFVRLLPYRTWVAPNEKAFIANEFIFVSKSGNVARRPLITQYRQYYSDLAVNSSWNAVALLKEVEMSIDSKAKRKFGWHDYVIEIYDLKYQ